MVILFILFVLFSLFVFLSIKYQNPYRSTFIFGKKGSGKSCFMVRQMLRYLHRGWTVYTDMPDVRIPGVRFVSLQDFSVFRPEPHSAIFLDEVGISMDNRSFKSFPPGLRDFFKYCRKMKCCVFMNSQAYDVDKKVRDTTDSLLLMQSIGSLICICRPVIRSVTLTEPSSDSESRIADSLRFGSLFSWRIYFMPLYFKYFDSLSMPSRDFIPYSFSDSSDSLYSHFPLYVFFHDLRVFLFTRAKAFRPRK